MRNFAVFYVEAGAPPRFYSSSCTGEAVLDAEVLDAGVLDAAGVVDALDAAGVVEADDEEDALSLIHI